jgi:hypothetical protein
VNHMIQLGFSKSLSEWIGSNLKKSGEQESWAFDLKGVIQMFNSYRSTSIFFFIESIKFKCLPLWNINNDIDSLNSEYKNSVGRLHIGLCWNIHQKEWR